MMKKLLLPLSGLVLCICVLLMACGRLLSQGMNDMYFARAAELTPATSYEEVLQHLLNTQEESGEEPSAEPEPLLPEEPLPDLNYSASVPSDLLQEKEDGPGESANDLSTESAAASVTGYALVPVPVEGVTEADLVQTDGDYIYALYEDQLRIYQAAGGSSRLVSRTDLWKTEDYSSRSATELYLWQELLAVVCQDYSWENGESDFRTTLRILDVSRPEQVRVLGELGQEGRYNDSRMVDGVVYLISDYSLWSFSQEAQPEEYIPALYQNGSVTLMDPSCILLPEISMSRPCYTVVSAVDLAQRQRLSAYTLLDEVSTIAVNPQSLFLCAVHDSETESAVYTERQYSVVDYASGLSTSITAFDLTEDGIALRASGVIPGQPLNAHALEEKDGYLRVAVTQDTTSWSVYTDEHYDFTNYRWAEGASSAGVYVLDTGLNVVGSLTGLEEDDGVDAVRFDDDLCYFASCRQTEPLFAVDLSDPAALVLRTRQELEGGSACLHPFGDALLFRLGQCTDAATGEAGLEMTMYDSSDPALPQQIAALRLEQYAASAALSDPRTLLLLPEESLIAFPVEDSRYLVFTYEDGAFLQLATLEGPTERYGSQPLRGMFLRDTLYLLCGDAGLRVYAGTSFRQLCRLPG